MSRTVSTLAHIVKAVNYPCAVTLCGIAIGIGSELDFKPGDKIAAFSFASRMCKRCKRSKEKGTTIERTVTDE